MKCTGIDILLIDVRKYSLQAVTFVMAFLLSGFFFGEFATAQDKIKDQPSEKSHKVYLTLANELGTPQHIGKTSFDCSDQIHTVAELTNYPKGKHLITVIWKDPAEEARERTEYEFNVNSADTRLWAWLNLSRAKGASLIQWIDPAAGLESFIGLWTIEVLIDGEKISKQQFDVSC